MRWLLALAMTFSMTVFGAAKGLDLRLHSAAADGNKDKVQALLKKGLSVNQLDENKYPAVYFAFDLADEELALILLKKMDLSLKSGEQKENLLFLAVRKNQEKSVEYLLSQKPELLSEKTANEMTVLMIAARYSTAKIVEMLLKKGADPKLKNSFGTTALEMAQKAQNTAVIRLLQKSAQNK